MLALYVTLRIEKFTRHQSRIHTAEAERGYLGEQIGFANCALESWCCFDDVD